MQWDILKLTVIPKESYIFCKFQKKRFARQVTCIEYLPIRMCHREDREDMKRISTNCIHHMILIVHPTIPAMIIVCLSIVIMVGEMAKKYSVQF